MPKKAVSSNRKHRRASEDSMEQSDDFPSAGSQPSASKRKTLRVTTREILFAVSIDFGTSFTGASYVRYVQDDSEKPFCISPDFPIKLSNTESKIPTLILLESAEPHKLLAFGQQAREKWQKHHDQSSVLLFEKYKLDLDNKIQISYSNASNVGVKSSLLVRRTFEAIKEVVLARIKVLDSAIDETKILWVISKPCGWFDTTTVTMHPLANLNPTVAKRSPDLIPHANLRPARRTSSGSPQRRRA
jgi:hypothetical protein